MHWLWLSFHLLRSLFSLSIMLEFSVYWSCLSCVKFHVNILSFLMLLWMIYFKNLNTLLFVYMLDYLLSMYLLWQSIYSQVFSLLWVIIFLAFWEFSADSVCKFLIICDLQIFSPISLFSFLKYLLKSGNL